MLYNILSLYRERESNPQAHFWARDFKSLMSLYHYDFHHQIKIVCGLELTFKCSINSLHTPI